MSQPWFPPNEIEVATGILATSLPVGIVTGFGITPLFVKDESDVQTMNWVWFIPAVISTAFTFAVFRVNKSKPPTPPSRSAADAERMAEGEMSYWAR